MKNEEIIRKQLEIFRQFKKEGETLPNPMVDLGISLLEWVLDGSIDVIKVEVNNAG